MGRRRTTVASRAGILIILVFIGCQERPLAGLLGTQIGPEELKEKGAAYENTQHLLGIEPEETPEGKKVQ